MLYYLRRYCGGALSRASPLLEADRQDVSTDGSALIRSKSSCEYSLERSRNYHNVSICVAFAARRSRYASQNMGKASVNIR